MDIIERLFKQKKECCGCTACVAICPNNALIMRSDEEGFEYPFLYKERCVECLLCVRVCPNKTRSS